METALRISNLKEYYFSKKLREVAQLKLEGKPIINLAIGNPDLPPSQLAIEAARESLLQSHTHGYQSYRGITELREAFAKLYSSKYDVKLNPETEILPLMGSKEGILDCSLAFLNPGDQVLVPNPGYPSYSTIATMLGAQVLNYNLTQETNWLPDIKALEKLNLEKVKLMWINFPHMPTGTSASLSYLESLLAFAQAHNIMLINDNPYGFILNNDPVSILQLPMAKTCALELTSMSKHFEMPGWRVGALLGAPRFVDTILKVKSNLDSGMSYALQIGAATALNEENKQLREAKNKRYASRRTWVYKIASALGCSYSLKQVGMFVWAKLPANQNSKEIVNTWLKTYHIFVAPGVIFGSQGEGYVRFSLCVPETALKAVLKRIEK